ncbi:MAG TPA: molybdate ABC transporter substrate-binding protein [Terriglobales bacterium]|nr:molybdate ABC transporter substrate-binding protein [Terriglobales bacterium]
MRGAVWVVFVLGVLAARVCAGEIRVAAAADTQFVLPRIARAFEQQTGTKASISFGSSGNLAAQIQSGAPFDAFVSADTGYVDALLRSGDALPRTAYEYAEGRLVLWAPENSKLDLSGGVRVLLDPAVKRIAIANPQHAPYGRAAEATLRNAGIYEQLRDKLVLGENISQAFQFVSSGNADVGVLSYSLARSPQGKGRYFLLPQSLYPPIKQSAVALARSQSRAEALAFVNFLRTPEAQKILHESGLEPASAEQERP